MIVRRPVPAVGDNEPERAFSGNVDRDDLARHRAGHDAAVEDFDSIDEDLENHAAVISNFIIHANIREELAV